MNTSFHQEFPQKEDKLFIGNFGDKDVASINWTLGHNKDDPFYFLISGYSESFNTLLSHILDKKSPDSKTEEITKDFYISPILFCFRHTIELILKNIIRLYKIGHKEINSNEIGFKINHEILSLFYEVKEILSKSDFELICDLQKSQIQNIINLSEELLKELEDFDRHSFAFRYPYERKLENGNLIFSLPPMSIDLNNLKVVGNKLLNFLGIILRSAESYCYNIQLNEFINKRKKHYP